MTTNEVKDYFKQIRREQLEIEHLAQMIQKEELTLLPKAVTYDRDRVQTSPENILDASMAEIAEMQGELQRSIIILKSKRAQGEAYIIKLDDADEREVMRYYYIDSIGSRLFTWEEVAKAMNMSMRSVFRIHGNALVNLSKIL